MKPKLLLLLLLFSCSAVFAQVQPQQPTVGLKGQLTDSVTNKGLEFVTVALKTEADVAVKSVLSKDDGSFVFEKIAPGKYKLVIVGVGYKRTEVKKEIDASATGVIDLGNILVAPSTTVLNEAVVTADRPIIKQEIDRIAYDVQADPENKVNTVLDMLRKVPLVTIDGEDNIQVKGSSSFKVLINGRPSTLVARSPKDVFKAMPASDIQRIEVITTPPAKYDSEGLAGIINIITNKKVDNGYNASLGLRSNYPWGYGGNGSITYKKGKFGIQLYSGLNANRQPETTSGSNRLSLTGLQNRLEQNGRALNKSNFGYGDTELSFEIDSLNLITGTFGLNGSNNTNDNSQFSWLYNSGGGVDQSYQLSNGSKYGWGGIDMGLNYQLGFKANKEQLLTASYAYNSWGNDQNSLIRTLNEVNFPSQNYRQENESGTREQTYQLDYIHPLKKINIEGGFKAILRNNYSDFLQSNLDPMTGQYIIDAARTNSFDYQQNVYGMYNSYQLKLKDWGIKAGLRLERTIINADFTSTSTEIGESYNNFIPSVSVQRKFKDMSSMTLGYTQRIERPGIWQLNPFVNQNDPRFIYTGNPNLEAALNHNFSLNYSKFKKGSINLGLSYSFADNTVQQVMRLRADNVTVSTFENIGQNKTLGTNISVNYPFTPKFNLNVNGGLNYVWIKGVFNGQELSNDGIQGNVHSYATYRFEDGWRASMSAGTWTPWIMLQGKSRADVFTSFSLNKEFLNKKANFSVSVSNPWAKMRQWRNETNSPDFTQLNYYNNFYRRVSMSLNYRFGKLQGEIKKNRRSINNDDVKSGGGSSN